MRNRIEILLAEGLIIVPAIIYIKNKDYDFFRVFRIKTISKDLVFLSIIIGFAVLAPIDELDTIIRKILPLPGNAANMEENLSDAIKVDSAYNFFILFISGAIIASIAEEMLFRGFLQGILEKSTDITKAILITALIFSLVHLWPWLIIQILLLGILLGFMVWISDSIIPAVIVHFIINSSSILIVNLDLKAPSWLMWKDHLSPLVILFSLIIFYYSFKLFYIFCVKERKEGNFMEDNFEE